MTSILHETKCFSIGPVNIHQHCLNLKLVGVGSMSPNDISIKELKEIPNETKTISTNLFFTVSQITEKCVVGYDW